MRALLLCLLTLVTVPWPALADPIRIQHDIRIVATGALVVVGRSHTQVQDRQDANDNLSASVDLASGDVSGQGAATLTSSIGTRHSSGSGTMSATATVLPSPDVVRHSLTFAISEFSVAFELDAPQRFDFSGLFTATSHVESLAILEGPASLVVFQTPPMSSGEFRQTGVIPAGSWGLQVHQRVEAFGDGPGGTDTQNGQFSFSFDLSDVSATPEPASLVLLGSGVLALVGMKRRQSAVA